MRKSIFAAALFGLCIQPVQAQMVSAPPPGGAEPVQMGGFVGARVRLSLGGSRSEEQTLRAGLAIAPMQYRGGGDLQGFRSRIGEGLEFGFRGGEQTPQLSFAGMRLTGGKDVAGKARSNLSDGATIALVVVGVVAVAGVALYAAADEADDV